MLYWALLFFIIAVIAAVFGFAGIAAGATWIAQILFVLNLLFLALFLVGLLVTAMCRPTI